MTYPGKSLRLGASGDAVRDVQRRLAALGCGPITVDGDFGPKTASAVAMFQSRRGLVADAVVGPRTWSELFEEEPLWDVATGSPFLAEALRVAEKYEGVRETAPNRGPEVDFFLATAGRNPEDAEAWCVAFLYTCMHVAATGLGVPNPMRRTAGVLDHYKRAPESTKLSAADALENSTLIRPGSIFHIEHDHGRGHAGWVIGVRPGQLLTREGNTNREGSRNGDTVRKRVRAVSEVNLGFVFYGG